MNKQKFFQLIKKSNKMYLDYRDPGLAITIVIQLLLIVIFALVFLLLWPMPLLRDDPSYFILIPVFAYIFIVVGVALYHLLILPYLRRRSLWNHRQQILDDLRERNQKAVNDVESLKAIIAKCNNGESLAPEEVILLHETKGMVETTPIGKAKLMMSGKSEKRYTKASKILKELE